MLDDGSPLVASLNGRLRLAVAGFTAGGHAALDGLAALDFDIYAAALPARPPAFRGPPRRLLRCRLPASPGLAKPSEPVATARALCPGALAGHREGNGVNDAAVALAYKHCASDNPVAGTQLLLRDSASCRPGKRAAMCALYAMARRIDDIGDGLTSRRSRWYGRLGRAGSPGHPSAALGEVRASLALLGGPPAGGRPASVPPGDPVLAALADARPPFPLPVAALPNWSRDASGTSRAAITTPSGSSSSTAAGLPAPSAACRWPFTAAPTAPRPNLWPTPWA